MTNADRARDAASDAKRAASRAADVAQDIAGDAESHPAARWVQGVGMAANGIVHFIIGAIALGVAFGGSGSADQSGAMRTLQQQPLGGVAIWFVAIAMLGLALHAIVTAIAQSQLDGKEALKSVGRAVGYGAVGVTGLTTALGGSSDGEQQTETLSGQLMAAPFGLVLIGALGLVVAGVGAYFVVRGAKKKFLKDVAPPARFRQATETTGMAGYIAKGIAIAIVGVLFVVAAVTHDPEQAGGLDGALQSLTTVPFGQILLVAIALGLVVYGAYCFARAAWPR
ncbi:DUF1206 domain-containing protein [Agrococcus sp. SL85]|uniref:DUF1206 domain-containing protein n=1 Tax=Agrococcus sp. SL85 TaxID=2995141 RepID=UPI00226C6BDE|nr:DUF1206 domain-containing protein [Agrococcus sp. SL85]WAC67150.1 DUF1206 domain-containing protein [Agrococcus sp. SL85]